MSGGSNQTIAYKTVSKVLRDKLSLDKQNKSSNDKSSKQELANGGKGCLFTIAVILTLPLLGIFSYIVKFHA
jgi:hypothetical protein